ncbi:MAG: lactonase family protein [Limosilactobacillus sp.]|uniref:lactonase family protein n=1 Tax=Limosilactobacillus sp. TaxID=2773925 RepID=UPI00270BCCE9|nr:lactonase family protein [Limosilactobacillus sp.]
MTEDFLIGTYTNKTSKGMYRVTLDTDAEKLVNVRLAVKMQKPSYLQVDSQGRVYTIKKRDDTGEKAVALYQLGETAKDAKLLCMLTHVGSSQCYLGLDEKRNLLFGANYHDGIATVFELGGEIGIDPASFVEHHGQTGPRPEQDGSHVHYVDSTPDGRVAVCDLGEDIVSIYDLSEYNQLSLVSEYHFPYGAGPRHLVFSKDGQFVYVICELSSELTVLKYNEHTAELTHVQTVKTIPDTWTEHNGAAAIRMTSDGRFIYTTNRGENTLAVWAVQDDGTVKHVQSISSEGDFPRDFNFSKDEHYLVSSNQETDDLVLYRRNPETGELTLLQKGVACPEPICVQRY